jgi:hypothetical protein
MNNRSFGVIFCKGAYLILIGDPEDIDSVAPSVLGIGNSLSRLLLGLSGHSGDHTALAKARSTLAIWSNRCPNPAPRVPL